MDKNVWVQEAEEKLKDARAALNLERFSAACFWAQQAAELALKGVYIARYKEAPPRVHDLLVLAHKVNAPEKINAAGTVLNPAYTEARYIDVTGKAPSTMFDEKDAKKAIENAFEVLTWSKSHLK